MDDYQQSVINQQEFHAGQGIDHKVGSTNSFAYSRGFDWRKDPSALVQAMQPRRIDAGNMTDLIIDMVQVNTGERFAIGADGTLYLIDTNNGVQKVDEIGEPAGGSLVYRTDTDMLYITGQKSLHAYGFISQGTRTMYRDFVSGSTSINTSGSYPSIRTGGSQTYTLLNSLSEASRLNFTSDIEPISKLIIEVASTGTGNWTFVLHDPLERELASITVPNASMTTGSYEVVYDPVSILVKPNARIYHWHIYSSDGTGTIRTTNAGSLDTANFQIYADRFLQTNNRLHPMVHFLQYLAILNDRYLSLWEPLTDAPSNVEFKRHRLTYPDNYQGCGLTTTDEFLVQGFEKVATDPSRQYQEGLLGFWDGLSGTYNFYIETKEGAPRALTTIGNIPHMVIAGTLYAWLGGKQLTRIRDLPNIDNDFTGVKDDTELMPNTMTVFKKLLHIGYPSSTSNTGLEFGVYNFGTVAPEYTPSFGYQYQNSHGERNTSGGTPLQIGCVRAFGDEMYISWKKGTQYGLDIVDSNCTVASDFKALMRTFDARNVHKPKATGRIIVTTAPVPAGTTVYPVYAVDDGTEVAADEPMATGATQAVFNIDGTRFHQISYGLKGTSESTVTDPLQVLGVALEWDPLPDEDITGQS